VSFESTDGARSGASLLGRLTARPRRAGAWLARVARRLVAYPAAPLVALCLLLVVSLFVRVIDLGQPCNSPCRTPAQHTLIFDEAYYVNAARVIDGINPPKGSDYHNSPAGDDPNAEHPQLAKLIIAGAIKLFGDDPRGWRLGSVLFGLIAMAALYSLVRAAGGGGWLAVGASAVMATDNLLLVHGRIGTLDIYAVAMMLVAATLYLRRRPALAGLALGVGGCMKEVSLYLLAVLVVVEFLRLARAWVVEKDASSWVYDGLRPLMACIVVSVVSFMGLLWLLDVLVPAYDPGTGVVYAGSPFTHLAHIYHYALALKSTPDSTGISSTPLQWLLNEKAINYARVAVNSLTNGKIVASRSIVFFQGEMNPFIIFLVIPAVFSAASAAWRRNDGVALVGLAWCLGTFLPSVAESLISDRVTYLYYMVIVMPGIYLVVTRLFAQRSVPTAATIGWAVALIYGFVDLYPLRMLL
jgi:4-amino-4-deoxy-L-arabinose transferase-like glycosyltransferase